MRRACTQTFALGSTLVGVCAACALTGAAGRVGAQVGEAEADAGASVVEAPGTTPGSTSPPAATPELLPPRVIEAVEPAYPSHRLPEGTEPVVVLHLTVETDGTVSDAHPEGEHDEDFDHAALDAVRAWRFAPATRGGVPIRARVRVAVRFALPEFEIDGDTVRRTASAPEIEVDEESALAEPSHEGVGSHEDPGDGPQDAGDDSEPSHALGVEAIADPLADASAPRTSSTYELDRTLLEVAPHRDAADLLSSAPGVYVARGEGDGVAHSIFLRGFDAEHGQDLELLLDGVPLNLPSHLHGQGYADLGALIPEVVLGVRVVEGVYDPRQGDFATAGSIDFRLGVPAARRGVHLAASYGSFDTFRALALFAPAGEREGSFVAATYRSTSGFGAQRGGHGGSAIAQWVFGEGNVRVRVLGLLSGARYGMAGVLRRDDVERGVIDFYGAYPYPTAAAQSGFNLRALASASVAILGARASFAELGLWVGYAEFRLLGNFTGFTETSRVNPEWRGRGDLIEQLDEHVSMGLRGRWRSEPWERWPWASARLELGVSGRLDLVSQAQNLIDATRAEVWDRRAAADIRALDVGPYVDLDVRLTEYVRVRGGVRGAIAYYGIDDALAASVPSDGRLTGARRTAAGAVALPRIAVEIAPTTGLVLSAAYGEGYRSPQALQLVDGSSAPFTRVASADLGARLTLGDHRELEASLTGFVTRITSDLAFDPGEGRLEPIGPSRRLGFAASATARPWTFVTAALSVTYVHATLDGPTPGSTEPYRPGELIPYVAPWTVRADAGAHHALVRLGPFDLDGEIGVGFTFLSPRPLPFGALADPVALLDAHAALGWGPVDLGVQVFNLTDARIAAIEYSFASNWSPSAPPSDEPVRHFTTGTPLTVLATLGVTL